MNPELAAPDPPLKYIRGILPWIVLLSFLPPVLYPYHIGSFHGFSAYPAYEPLPFPPGIVSAYSNHMDTALHQPGAHQMAALLIQGCRSSKIYHPA
jgi:hypothetical protein